MNPISLRLLSQQLCCPQFTRPEEVVAHMGAMQAQDYRMMRWAVMMRMRRPSVDAFRHSFDEGKIICLHLLRGTWQLVAAVDYWWMLSLFAPKAEATIRGWMKARGVAIGEDEARGVRGVLVKVCRTLGSATKEDFAGALVEHGWAMDSHRLDYHLRLAEVDGTLCSGRLSPMRSTYALAEEKVPRRGLPDRDGMLSLLARKYFQSHSPATVEDFAWWTGLGLSDCRRALHLLGSELHPVVYRGFEFLVHESCRTRGFRRGRSLLLPPYDEYLVAYKSRSLVLPEEHAPRAYNAFGIFHPVVLHDGEVCANWAPWRKSLELEVFRTVDATLSLEEQWSTFCRCMK